jgi:hypothetical protein
MSLNDAGTFTVQQVEAILKRALKEHARDGGITREELIETARELGISPSEVEKAIRDEATLGEFERAKEEWHARRRNQFFRHLQSFAIINGFLFLLNMATGGGFWFVYPLLAWGVGLAFDAAGTFNPSSSKVDRGARKLMKKRAWHRLAEDGRHAIYTKFLTTYSGETSSSDSANRGSRQAPDRS